MNSIRRGVGIGLEISTDRVYGVRLHPDAPGRIAAWSEVPIAASAAGGLGDALIRVFAELGGNGAPVHVGWFPDNASIRATDVTGWDTAQINQRRADLLSSDNIRATLEMASGARKYLLGVALDHVALNQLRHDVQRVVGAPVTVEPSPIAAARVAATDSLVAERGLNDLRWSAAIVDGVVLLADAGPGDDIVSWTTFATRPDELRWNLDPLPNESTPQDTLRRVSGSVTTALPPIPSEISVYVLQDVYPNFGGQDPRARERAVVALGAALGAAGLAGRVQTINVTAPPDDVLPDWALPWAIERVDAANPTEQRTSPTSWERFQNWLFGRS